MTAIRMFAYLDEYKMYSASSQLFEGLTEYVLKHSAQGSEEVEEQKGPYGSGRILANIATEQGGKTEKRFLHDHAYALFESELLKDERTVTITPESTESDWERLRSASFVKVSGATTFVDYQQVWKTIAEFNTLGIALAYVTHQQLIQGMRSVLEKAIETAKRGPEKTELRRQLKELADPELLAKNKGLHQDPLYLERLSYLLEYGYAEAFEAEISVSRSGHGQQLFSATLDKSKLKDDPAILVRKYSRSPQREFTLFGIVAQSDRASTDTSSAPLVNASENTESATGDENDPTALKRITRELVRHIATMEQGFTGRLPNEVVIDPIALFCKL